MIRSLEISSSALTAQRVRLDVIAQNMANADVTRQADGTPAPYRRRVALFAAGDGQGGPGVHVAGVAADPSPFKLRHEPTHPDADAAGYVHLPNVSLTMEYVDALAASRAYEANAAMVNVSRGMIQQAMRLLV
jgi:flagellar basal-body rod protein FlgC